MGCLSRGHIEEICTGEERLWTMQKSACINTNSLWLERVSESRRQQGWAFQISCKQGTGILITFVTMFFTCCNTDRCCTGKYEKVDNNDNVDNLMHNRTDHDDIITFITFRWFHWWSQMARRSTKHMVKVSCLQQIERNWMSFSLAPMKRQTLAWWFMHWISACLCGHRWIVIRSNDTDLVSHFSCRHSSSRRAVDRIRMWKAPTKPSCACHSHVVGPRESVNTTDVPRPNGMWHGVLLCWTR